MELFWRCTDRNWAGYEFSCVLDGNIYSHMYSSTASSTQNYLQYTGRETFAKGMHLRSGKFERWKRELE